MPSGQLSQDQRKEGATNGLRLTGKGPMSECFSSRSSLWEGEGEVETTISLTHIRVQLLGRRGPLW